MRIMSEKEYSISTFLDEYIDIDHVFNNKQEKQTFIEYINKVLPKKGQYWNESINQIYSKYEKFLNNESSFFKDGKIDDLLKADAGNSFLRDEKWVIPWERLGLSKEKIELLQENYGQDYISDKIKEFSANYKEVRGNDKFLKILTNDKNLQFTHEKGSDWIRLIMPKNTRRVEIEDLNRNFWVISVVVGAILSYLYDDSSPLKEIFKDILDEILQLWENCFYLWFLFEVISKEKIGGIFTDCPFFSPSCPNGELQYDNFDVPSFYDLSNLSTYNQPYFLNFFRSYRDKYPNQNLLILPQFRINNYKHNYFKEIVFPVVYLYDVFSKQEKFIGLKLENGDLPAFSIQPAKYNLKNYSHSVCSVCERNEREYKKIQPFSRVDTVEEREEEIGKYYAAVRALPKIEFDYNNSTFNFNISIDFQDCIKKAFYDGSENRILNFSIENVNLKIDEQKEYLTVKKEEFLPALSRSRSPISVKIPYRKANFYLGEVVSDYKETAIKLSYEVESIEDFTNDGLLIKIGNFLPAGKLTFKGNDNEQPSEICLAVTSKDTLTSYDLNLTFRKSGGIPTNGQGSISNQGFYIPFLTDENKKGKDMILNDKKEELQAYWTYKKEPIDNSLDLLSIIKDCLNNKDYANNREKLKGYLNFEVNSQLSFNLIKQIGFLVIKEYLEQLLYNNVIDENKYLAIVSGIGCLPWRGLKQNQYFYERAILCHLYYYIPQEIMLDQNGKFRKDIEAYPIIIEKYGVKTQIGFIAYGGEVNKTERAFGRASYNGNSTLGDLYVGTEQSPKTWFENKEIFVVKNKDRWRFPQLDTIKEQQTSLKLRATRENETYFYYLELSDELKELRKTLNNDEEFKEIIKQRIEEPNSEAERIIVDDEITNEDYVYNKILKQIFKEVRFTWSVYDGYCPLNDNESNEIQNEEQIGRIANKYRSVFRVDLKVNKNLTDEDEYSIKSVSNIYTRAREDNDFKKVLRLNGNPSPAPGYLYAEAVLQCVLSGKGFKGALVFQNGDNDKFLQIKSDGQYNKWEDILEK